MARGDTGKWVARAGATGGGRSYGRRTPVNWYLGVTVIVLLGLASIAFARYQNQHPTTKAQVQPTVGTTWYAGIGFDICGSQQPALAANTAASGIQAAGQGIITVAPATKKVSGHGATLGVFVSGYSGLTLTASTVQYPSGTKYTNGQTCAKGTPDAGKAGTVMVEHWPNFSATTGQAVTGNPALLRFSNGQLITVAFLPKGTSVPKPPKSVSNALLSSLSGTPPTTTTTAPPSTTTTAPGATTTTAPPTTTTAPPATTTTAPAKNGSTKSSKK